MRRRILVCVGLVLGATVNSWGQDPPPPGFAPAQDGAGQNAPSQDDSSGPGSFFNQYSPPPSEATRPPYEGANLGGRMADPQSRYPAYGVPAGPSFIDADPWPAPRFWLKAEALLWWTKDSPVPVPLVTAGSMGDHSRCDWSAGTPS